MGMTAKVVELRSEELREAFLVVSQLHDELD